MPPEPAGRHGHADTVAATLAQWAGCRLDARGQSVFGMAGAFPVKLAKLFDVLEAYGGRFENSVSAIDCLYACEMEHCVQQHRCMTVRKYESITIGPYRIVRIEAQEALPQCVHDRSERHWRARMSGICLLHSIDGKRAYRVDAKVLESNLPKCVPAKAQNIFTARNGFSGHLKLLGHCDLEFGEARSFQDRTCPRGKLATRALGSSSPDRRRASQSDFVKNDNGSVGPTNWVRDRPEDWTKIETLASAITKLCSICAAMMA